MVILGIDPGIATTGYGTISSKTRDIFEVLDFGIITTKKTSTESERLEILSRDLHKLIKKYKPERIGVEKLFFTTNHKTAMSVSQARGVVLLIAQKNRVPAFEFTPLQVKSMVCGYGKAPKSQVQFMVQKAFKLKSLPKPDDAADALAIALCASMKKLP